MIISAGPDITVRIFLDVKYILVGTHSRNSGRGNMTNLKSFPFFYLANAWHKTAGPYHTGRNLTQRQKDMVLIVRYRFKGTEEWLPFFGIGLIKADTIAGCKPKVTVTVLQYIMDLIVHQWKTVADGVSYQIITSITVVSDGDAGRIIGKPDAFLLIHINIIDIVSVHPVITIIISSYIGFTHACIHI